MEQICRLILKSDLLGGGGELSGAVVGEEGRHVGDVGVTAGFELGFDFGKHGAQFFGQGRGKGIEDGAFFAHDVIDRLVVELNLIKAGAVMEEAAAHKTEVFEGSETAVNGDKIAGAVFETHMDLFNGRGLGTFDERIKDRNTRLGDAEAGRLETAACLL